MILLPSTTVHVLSPTTALDAHGHASAYEWAQRGPYAAHLSSPGHSEQLVDHARQTTSWTVQLAPEAWPVRAEDRLLLPDGRILQVTGARLVPDLGAAPLAHVSASCTELAEATA